MWICYLEDRMNISEINKNICTGCALCTVVCPNKAISLSPNSEGFLFPKVNDMLCVNCGKCYENCPNNHKTTDSCLQPQKVYACQA